MNIEDAKEQLADMEAGAREPDRRVLAMQQFVKAEASFHDAVREVEKAQKRAAVAEERLGKYRQELHAALGLNSPNVGGPARTVLSDGSEW
jgi:hypothetical protein